MLDEKFMALQRQPNGQFRMAVTNEKGIKRLEDNRNTPERIEHYFGAVFKERPKDDPEEKRRRFMKTYEKTQCFNCADRGFYTVTIETPLGQVNDFAFACPCEAGIPGTESIMALVQTGGFTLQCELGGEDGSCCQLVKKQGKCFGFRCPKFDGGAK